MGAATGARPDLATFTRLIAVGMIVACGSPDPGAIEDDAAVIGVTPTTTAILPDTLLFTTAAGYDVYWTTGRNAMAAEGATCVERGVLIQRDSVRRLVPLLYTTAPPGQVNDTTLHATLSTRCAPGTVYRVNLRTAQPLPETP